MPPEPPRNRLFDLNPIHRSHPLRMDRKRLRETQHQQGNLKTMKRFHRMPRCGPSKPAASYKHWGNNPAPCSWKTSRNSNWKAPEKTASSCQKHGILVESRPLGIPESPILSRMADKYKGPAAQLCLCWTPQHGGMPPVKSTPSGGIKANPGIFNFSRDAKALLLRWNAGHSYSAPHPPRGLSRIIIILLDIFVTIYQAIIM